MSIWQGGPGASQACDSVGNWQRTTPGTISDSSYKRNVMAFENEQQYRNNSTTILENDTHTIAGNKEQNIIGKYSAAVASDINMTTASDFIISAANKLELVAGNEFREVIKNLRSIKADKLYIGDQQDNLLQLILELMTATATLATAVLQPGIAQQIELIKLRLIKMLPLE